MPTPLKIKKLQLRSATADKVDITEIDGKKFITFPFSSEMPVDRYFGAEILSHDKGSMDLSRLKNHAPLLFNHNMDLQLGKVVDAWIGDDKRGYCKVQLAENAFAIDKQKDIASGILVNVSFAYEINDLRLKEESKDAPPVYIVTAYQPYEICMVTCPADNSVGLLRSLGTKPDGLLRQLEDQPEVEMNVEAAVPPAEAPVPEPEPVKPAAVVDETESPTLPNKQETETQPERKKQMTPEEILKRERQRVAEIARLEDKFGFPELARQLREGELTIDECRGAYLEKMGAKKQELNGNEALVGLTQKEIRQFSFVRAIVALMNPRDPVAQEAAKFEREVSEAAVKAGGKAARGFMVPVDVLRAGRRDLLVGTASAGGHTVATELLAGSFIDLLRNKSVLQRAGARVLNGLVGSLAIPRLSGGATAYWVAENAASTESQQAFEQVAMSPKGLGGFTDYSRKLMLQSSLDVESLVRNDLAKVLALEIDRAGLYGSGSDAQPTGLKNVTGINTLDLAAAAATYLEIIEMETKVADDNADIGALKYLVNPTGRGGLKGTEKFANGSIPVWEPGNTVNGYSTEVSKQVASGDFWFGNFDDLIMGFWSGLDLIVDPYTGATAGTVRVVANQDVDVAVRHPESFCRANNTL